MNRILIAFVALAVLLSTAAVTSAQKQKPPGKSRVSLKASSNPVQYRVPFTLTASLKDAATGQQVTLQRRRPTGAYVDLATAAVNAQGDAAFTRRARRNTTYRAVTVEATPRASDDLLLKVAPRVGFAVSDSTPAAGTRTRFRGRVRPQHDGRRVQIQRRQADGSWLTIARAKLRDTERRYSRYSRRIAVDATAVVRVVLPEHADHAAGISRERTLSVAG